MFQTHVNPCFHKKKGKSSFSPFTDGTSVELNDGDAFALLPDNYQYEVYIHKESNGLPEVTNENSANKEENDSVADGDEEDRDEQMGESKDEECEPMEEIKDEVCESVEQTKVKQETNNKVQRDFSIFIWF